MSDNNIEIRLVKTWQEKDIIELYKAGNWWKENYDSSKIKPMIKNSYAFALAIDNSSGKTVGMGRLISDGISDAYIQDLVVLDEYRGRKIGQRIINKLIDHCKKNGILWIGLIAEPGNVGFFSKFNLKPMKNHTPMLYQEQG